MSNPQLKRRRCLKCGREFLSHSFANRICGKCNEANRREAPVRTTACHVDAPAK